MIDADQTDGATPRVPSRLDVIRLYGRVTALVWIVATAFVGWTIVRSFGLERGYPAVPLLAFTPYVALLAPLAAGLALLLARRVAALAIALCALLLIAQVAPRAFDDSPPDPRPQGPKLRVLGANLLDGGAELEPIAALIREQGIDVVSFSELTPKAARRISQSEIAEMLPYSVVDPRGGSSGTGLLSRYPLRRLPAPGSEGIGLPSVVSAVEVPGGGADVYSIHPPPPSNPAGTDLLEGYLDAIPPADPAASPRVLVGDFNSTLDSSALREVLDSGYADAADARGSGLAPTWPGGLLPPPVTIDHVIVDDRVEVLDYETAELPGSDHRAVVAALRLPGVPPGTFAPDPTED